MGYVGQCRVFYLFHRMSVTERWVVYGTLLVGLLASTQGYFSPERFPGPYCATLPAGQRCCASRNDRCSLPIRGYQTRCYCDQFCDDRGSRDKIDCCPDFHNYRSDCTKHPGTQTKLALFPSLK